jgi:excisionase family DNA binding protein
MSTGLSDCDRRILDAQWDGRSTFSIPEAGKILGLSRWGAYEAARRGEIPVVRVGRRAIVPRHRLERLLEGA